MNYKVLSSAFISTVLAGGFFYYYKFYKKDNKLVKDDEEKYEEKHLKDFKKLDETKKLDNDILTDETKKPVYIKETTPNGDLIMHFDLSLNHYKYYIDDKTIPYKYLESAARKFCITYDCRGHFIEMLEELKISSEKLKEESLGDKLKNQVASAKKTLNRAFANFKKYETKPSKRHIVPEKSNTYKHMGKLVDFEEKYKEKNEVCAKKIDYTQFKNKIELNVVENYDPSDNSDDSTISSTTCKDLAESPSNLSDDEV